ncbi:PAS domain-containing sensor histidine kinase [Hymenobacter siberiensis]|jgi:PAS domain S-box-containing protein|uniref:PAS domain-containing sensor histidine kinase n=1 Tax=Hymenobacter siberiensis TaxID=2848396 RepID=UPI001C1E5773|nr:PAS domain S-box protein [Hymenobacter siberiensis]MBU6122636.1 PAS domain S-box protein [Hymenobacter siberiensis]
MLPPDTPAPLTDLHASLLELRTRAEQRRALVTQPTELHSPEEMQRLVQELQVHQIELEMQYEELLLTQTEAQAARSQYVDLYDYAPVGYFTLTDTGLIEQLNFCGARLLGTVRQQLARRRFTLFVVSARRLDFEQFLARVFSSDSTQSIELKLQQEDGTTFFGQLEGLRVDSPAGPQCRLAVLDTTARQQATTALAASEARFRKLFTESYSAVVLVQGYHFVDCNAAALRLLGTTDRQQLVGQVAWAHSPEYQPDGRRTIDLFHDTMAEALRTGSQRCEAVMRHATGKEIWVEAVFTPIELGGSTPVVHTVWRDITAARQAQQQQRQSKGFTESLLDNTFDGIIAVDQAQCITAWNAQATTYFGREAAEVLGRPLAEVLPYLNNESQQLVARALAGERIDLFGREFQQQPGRYDVHIVPLYHNGKSQPSGVLTVVRDVTERDRLAEEATQQRLRRQQEVLAAILDTQETERKRIAEALHNGLGQLLYATKLSLAGRAGVPGLARESLKLLDEAIRATRTISFELTPGVLEDFGLQTALQELVKRIAPSGLPVRLHLLGLGHRLNSQAEIGVYRTVQELLNNVMKHAHATEAVVHVAYENGRLDVSVEDNGCGFEPAALVGQPLAGIGLAGVRNRVALLGGRLAISSRLGQGTIVSFELEV